MKQNSAWLHSFNQPLFVIVALRK